ncbi:hypothetical protein BGZ61DRAFT_375782, partial [Ilyonectria robusta]|uniref:uncharacterized protein n=1 Tax=Ilyonectria robusta TaxID=1079257 RepID=UPI001E8DCED5
NILLFRAIKAPLNSISQLKIISPLIIITLHTELTVTSYINIHKIVTFLYKEFNIIISKSAISRALKEIR